MRKITNWLLGHASTSPIKKSFVTAGYHNPKPSLPDLLSFTDFCDEKNIFLLNDGISIGSGFELSDIAAEAASPEYLDAVFQKVKETFAAVVPMHALDPWVMQIYVNDDYNYAPVLNHITRKIQAEIVATPFTQDYLALLIFSLRLELQIS